MKDETVLCGGVNAVRRRGDRVHRPVSAATPAIHRLLRHLRDTGFDAAPEPFGFDAEGDEILSFLEGQVIYPLPAGSRTPELLRSVGELLRRFHDASASFARQSADAWQLPSRAPAEVICHGDVAPYNCVVRAGRVVGLFDFDTAHPGPRVWDLAYTVYRFAPLHAPTNPDSDGDQETQARRATQVCSGYGWTPDGHLLDTVVDRLVALVALIQRRAAAGDAAFQSHIDAGHVTLYQTDISYLRAERPRFLRTFAD